MVQEVVLVIGATGKTGRRIVPRLRRAGQTVRAVSRSSPRHFDWDDRSTWEVALLGVTAMYVVPPSKPGPVHGFMDAAEQAGVERVVLLSGHGADLWGDSVFGADMRSAEDAVRSSSSDWTVLRAANFYQNFDENVFEPALVAGELALPAGPVPEPFIDIEDVADIAARLLVEKGTHSRSTYELTGSRAWTFAEAVGVITQISGLPMTYRQVSITEYKESLITQGVEEVEAEQHAEMFTIMASGVLAHPSQDVERLLSRPPRVFEDYVVRAAAAGAWQRK